jgi:hypothetical protein
MKVKEIILLILIVVGGVFLYHAQTGKLDVAFEIDGHFLFPLHQFKYEEYTQLQPPFPSRLKIINAHGNVEIQGADEQRMTISFQKKIWRRKEKQAKEVSDALKMSVQKDSNELLITTNRDEFRKRNFETSFIISLPKSMEVEVENSYGSVKVLNAGSTSITNPHGKVTVSQIQGEVVIKNSYEDVEIKNVQAGCRIESKHSTVLVSNVGGKAEVVLAHGNVHLDNISKEVKVEGSHTEVIGQNLSRASEIITSYEKVSLSNVGPTKINCRHSTIEVDGARDFVDITDNYSTVRVSNLQGNLVIDGRSLKIYGKKIVGQEISVASSYENIELADFSGKTTIKNVHGEISLQPLPLTHPLEVKGEYANIRLYWPSGGKYPLEAKAKNGEIRWKLPVKLSFHEENSFSTIKAFLEEIGAPSIFLSTSYGTIWVGE